jgi:hypothetical protein
LTGETVRAALEEDAAAGLVPFMLSTFIASVRCYRVLWLIW